MANPSAVLAPPYRRGRRSGAPGSTVLPTPAAPSTPNTPSPTDTLNPILYTRLSWLAAGQAKADIYLDTVTPPVKLAVPNFVGTAYVPTLLPSTTYYWQIVAKNDGGSATGPIWSFTTPSATKLFVMRAGVYTPSVRAGSITIHDALGAAANLARAIFDTTTPIAGQSVLMGLGGLDPGQLIFGGEIQSQDQTFVDTPSSPLWPEALVDYTFRLNTRRPIGTFVNVSATTVLQTIAARSAPGFTVTHVQAGLPPVTITFDGTQDFSACGQQLATLLGAGYYFRVDYSKDLHLGLGEPADTPVDVLHKPLNDPTPLVVTTELSQVRTRVIVIGASVSVPADVGAGETIVPVSAMLFEATGGQAITGGQVLTYAGVQLGGGGSLVGPGQSPSVAPSASPAAGSGLGLGLYGYAYTDVTAAGESLPSPLGSVTTAALPQPTIAPAIDTGFAGYGNNGSVAFFPGDTVEYAYTYSAASVSTDYTLDSALSAINSFVAVKWNGSENYAAGPKVSITETTDPIVKFAKLWRRVNAGTWQHVYSFVPPQNGPLLEGFFSLHNGLPTAVTALRQAAISGIAVGPSGTTSKNLYRTALNQAQLKLLANIATATTTYADSTPDASLGANVPTGDTSGLSQPGGQVNAGATSIPTTSTAPFAATGGWALLPGGQTIRYTKVGLTNTIGFDAASTATTGSGTSLSWTHTCSVAANRLLLVQAFAAGGDKVTGITYNSVAMTLVGKTQIGSAADWTYLYALVAPASGAHTITITYGTSSSLTNGCASSYIGAQQVQPEASATATSTNPSTTLTASVTPISSDVWVVLGGASESNPILSVNKGSIRANATAGSFLTDTGPVGSLTTIIASGYAGDWGGVIAAIAPVGDGTGLAGIPASGPGAITTTVLYGGPILPAPALTGVNANNGLGLALVKGASLALWVLREDVAAQETLGQLELDETGKPTDGVHEFTISAPQATSVAQCAAVGDADLAIFARPIVSLAYTTRTLTRSGTTVLVNLRVGYANTVLADVPVAYWRLAEASGASLADLSGNSRTITLTVTTGVGYSVPGALADGTTGLSFDGAHAFNGNLAAAIVTGTTFSIEFFFTPNGDTSGYEVGFQTLCIETGSLSGLYYKSDVKKFSYYYAGDHFSSTALVNGVTYHIVLSVVAGVGTWYVNGVADGTLTGVPSLSLSRLFSTGSGGVSEDPIKSTLVDELAVYGVALSPTQIATHYLQRLAADALGGPWGITGSFVVQDVTITFDGPELPRFAVKASSTKFSLEDLLRRVQVI